MDDDECVDCPHTVPAHDNRGGCQYCGCTRVLFFDDDRPDDE